MATVESEIPAAINSDPEEIDGGIFVEVNHPACQSHGRCQKIAPEVFLMAPEYGGAYPAVLLPRPPARLVENVRRAAALCPTKAILIRESRLSEGDAQ
jgi:ferredoxin